MTIERGCTSETDESLYKCETLEDGSRLENCSKMKLVKISAINVHSNFCKKHNFLKVATLIDDPPGVFLTPGVILCN